MRSKRRKRSKSPQERRPGRVQINKFLLGRAELEKSDLLGVAKTAADSLEEEQLRKLGRKGGRNSY